MTALRQKSPLTQSPYFYCQTIKTKGHAGFTLHRLYRGAGVSVDESGSELASWAVRGR
jgi:hypothetical protein